MVFQLTEEIGFPDPRLGEESGILTMDYDKLFTIENVNDIPEDKTYNDYLNPESLTVVANAKIEPALANAANGEKFQFVRNGYFVCDIHDKNVYNRIVTLKDSFAKTQKKD